MADQKPDYHNLKDLSIQDVVDGVQRLKTVGSEGEIRSVMAVVAKCTMVFADTVKKCSASADRLTKKIIFLYVLIAVMMVVQVLVMLFK